MSSSIYYRRWDGVLVSLELGDRNIIIKGEQYEQVMLLYVEIRNLQSLNMRVRI